jgi:hypothetical protein
MAMPAAIVAAMRRRTRAGALAAAVACALGAAAPAAADELSDYRAVRGDWQRDSVLTACRFTVEELENARSVMTGEDEYSGLEGAIGAEIVRQRTGGCPGGGGVEGTPVVSRLRAVPRSLHGRRAGTLRFGISRAAIVRVAIERRRGARWVRVRSLVRGVRRAGNATVALPARGLRPGAYRAVVTAVAGGTRSRPRSAAFRVLG